MAKTSFIEIPDDLKVFYSKSLTSSDRFQTSAVRRKPIFSSRKKIAALTQKSVMPLAKIEWQKLTAPQKAAWVSASAVGGSSGWSLFLQDYAIRLQNGLTVPGTPSDIVQYKVGHIEIANPASSIKLEQVHPLTYWVNKKVSGTRNQYQPVKIIESFLLPLEIGISWRTSLVVVGANPFAKFYAVVLSHYQGRDIFTPLEIVFGFNDNWQKATVTLPSAFGLVKGYSVFIECSDVTGFVEFDDVIISHSGQNWARDPRCNSVNTSFTKAFFQIPDHWAPVSMPAGSYFDSRYYDLSASVSERHIPFALGTAVNFHFELPKSLPFCLGDV